MLDHRTLPLSRAVGRYAVSYVRKVCAQAHVGFTETTPDEDVLAVDGFITYPILDMRVQIKGTTQQNLHPATGTLSFPIEPLWRTKWRRNRNPAYFIYVLMERPVPSWFQYNPSDTLAGAYALWARIDTLDEDATHVMFDRQERFTEATVGAWFQDLVAGFEGG